MLERAVKQKSTDFDFERWRRLAESNPAQFEKEREAVLKALIDGVGDKDIRTRLSRVQWRVDMERRRSSNPLGSCIRMYNMMWESVNQSYELMESLVAMTRETAATPAGKCAKARVLQFKRESAG